MWLPTVPTRAQPESSAAPSTARRSSATSLRSPRSCARVARAGVWDCAAWASAAAAAFVDAVVAALAAVFFADAVSLAVAFVAPAAVLPPVAVLVAFAVARRRPDAGAAGSSAADDTASAVVGSGPTSAWPLGEESRLSTRKRVHALWNGAGVFASPKP